MRRRGVAITVAVVLAIFGTVGVLAYVNHANARALAGQRAVTVLIAKQLIPVGTSAGNAKQNGLLGTETLPAKSVPADAITSVTPDISGLVTNADLQPGQLLLRPMLVTSAQASTGFSIPSGKIAISLLFCLPEAVAGNVRPGSEVAVFNTYVSGGGSGGGGMSASTSCSGPHQAAAGVSVKTKLILPKVTVLAVGTASANTQQGGSQSGSTSSSSSSQGTELLTVAVSQSDAERLIELSQDGLPYLALVNSSSSLGLTATGAGGLGG